MYRPATTKRGFTLLELLVAISIFSMVSVMAYAGLQTVLKSKQSTNQNSQRVAQVQLLMMRLGNDLRQAAARTIRDEYGDYIPAMTSGQAGEASVSWTRTGYRNPVKLRRSQLQRVGYQLEQDKLIRLTWPVLDRAQDSKGNKTELLAEVDSIEWRFLNHEGEWLSHWPAEEQNAELSLLPKAVEITLELADWGKVKRLILLPSER